MLARLKSAVKRVLHRRSSHWRTLELATLDAHPSCSACGNDSHLQVHHVQPYHLHPELELDPTNVVVLCELPGRDCHLYIGHGGSFSAYNPEVRAHAAELLDSAILEGAGFVAGSPPTALDPARRAAVAARARAARLFA